MDSSNKNIARFVARILQCVALGLLVALFWSVWNANRASNEIIVRAASAQAQSEPEEPVYRDKSGRRINRTDYEIAAGYDKAQSQGIASHAECRRMEEILERSGCNKYVTEHKYFPPHIHQANWDSGKTSAQCLAEVNAYWQALIQEHEEMGDDPNGRAIQHYNLDWYYERRECANYDNMRGAPEARFFDDSIPQQD
jgi:hypothetical protein